MSSFLYFYQLLCFVCVQFCELCDSDYTLEDLDGIIAVRKVHVHVDNSSFPSFCLVEQNPYRVI
jgi:hypothetical protein